MRILRLGEYSEILVVVERITAVRGVPETNRAGETVIDGDRPVFRSSLIEMDTGNSIPVPNSPEEILTILQVSDQSD